MLIGSPQTIEFVALVSTSKDGMGCSWHPFAVKQRLCNDFGESGRAIRTGSAVRSVQRELGDDDKLREMPRS